MDHIFFIQTLKRYGNMLTGANIRLGEDYFLDREYYDGVAMKVVYTGPIDAFYEYRFGRLQFRSLHFEFGEQEKTVITKEYSVEWKDGMEPYYPINDTINSDIYNKYKCLADKETKYIFGGRLAEYKYYDMDKIIKRALDLASKYSD